MKPLHRVDIADGSLLDIACGLESIARRFDNLVDSYVPGEREDGPDDDRTVDLLLGLVAVRERVRAMLDGARVDIPAAAADVLEDKQGSWLR